MRCWRDPVAWSGRSCSRSLSRPLALTCAHTARSVSLTQSSFEPHYLVALRRCFEVVNTQADMVLLSRYSSIVEYAQTEARYAAAFASSRRAAPASLESLEDKPEAVAYRCWRSLRVAVGLDSHKAPGEVLQSAHAAIEWLYRCDLDLLAPRKQPRPAPQPPLLALSQGFVCAINDVASLTRSDCSPSCQASDWNATGGHKRACRRPAV